MTSVHPDTVAAAEDVRDYSLAHGGGTFKADTLTRVEPRSGYAVGIRGGESIEADFPQVIVYDILRVRRRVMDRGGRYLGTWVDGGTFYTDPIAIIEDKDEAVSLAFINDQRAIYSFATGEVIPVRYPEDDPRFDIEWMESGR